MEGVARVNMRISGKFVSGVGGGGVLRIATHWISKIGVVETF